MICYQIRTKGVLSLLLSASLLISLPVLAAGPQEQGAGSYSPIKVLTRNLYVGADLTRVVSAGSLDAIPVAVLQTLQIVQQTNFPERAVAIADEVEQTMPDLIGLQEVSLLRTQFPGDAHLGNPVQAQDVMYDYLAILLAELEARDLHYQVAAIVQDADVEVPAFAGFDPYGNPMLMDVRLTDHDVILARKHIAITDPVAQNYAINLAIPVTDEFSIDFTRGYTTVDARVRGKWYRVANTHLELDDLPPMAMVQSLQAQELVGVLSASPLPVVLMGDLNSTPDDVVGPTGSIPAYMQFSAANFVDVWLYRRGGADPGYTCCQSETLDNETSMLDQRIDYIFVRSPDGDPNVLENAIVVSRTTGDDSADKTDSGLWPSDHAGLWARLHW